MKERGSMKNSNPVIICRDLCASYGREEILHNVSLDIQEGSFLPFIGPNGAGKTTLLRVILGLNKPLKGTLITPFHKKVPGYVPQHKIIDPLYRSVKYPNNFWPPTNTILNLESTFLELFGFPTTIG